MVHRPVTLAYLVVGTIGNGLCDEVFGQSDRVVQRLTVGKKGCHRRGEGTAGTMGILGWDARR